MARQGIWLLHYSEGDQEIPRLQLLLLNPILTQINNDNHYIKDLNKSLLDLRSLQLAEREAYSNPPNKCCFCSNNRHAMKFCLLYRWPLRKPIFSKKHIMSGNDKDDENSDMRQRRLDPRPLVRPHMLAKIRILPALNLYAEVEISQERVVLDLFFYWCSQMLQGVTCCPSERCLPVYLWFKEELFCSSISLKHSGHSSFINK